MTPDPMTPEEFDQAAEEYLRETLGWGLDALPKMPDEPADLQETDGGYDRLRRSWNDHIGANE